MAHSPPEHLSIQPERNPIRKKQSQRFTVTHNPSAPSEPVPPLPTNLSQSDPFSSPSISSISDSDRPTSVAPHNPQHMSNPPGPTHNNFDATSLLSGQFSGGSAPISRSATNLSSAGSNAPNALGNMASMNMNTGPAHQIAGGPEAEDDIIPTAIVIKNIPFSVRREQLLAIIEDLMIPLPYAFNYHFDNGVFRGLAFANFRSASETDAAVAGLNGFDISGRKLRVEYKKVLQAGEKERIEKEKAIKRMRSMQLQKESSMLDQYAPQTQSHLPISSSSTHITFGNYSGLEDEYRAVGMHNHGLPLSLQHGASQSVLNSANSSSFPHPYLSSNSELGFAQQAFENLNLSGTNDPSKSSKELDMNDPQTLELYSRIVVFKEDKLRDELSFAKSLSGPQRRIVHQIAKKVGLEHRSEGVGDERFVVVSKQMNSGLSMPRMSRVASSANMSRAASGQQYQFGTQPNQRFDGGLTTANLLRMKKSMPDMRIREMNSGVFYPDAGMKELLGRKSTMNLRDVGMKSKPTLNPFSFNSQQQQQQQQQQQSQQQQQQQHHEELGSQSGSSVLNNGNNNLHQIIRQPKGPEGGSGKGFGNNLHNPSHPPSSQRALHHQPSSRTELNNFLGHDNQLGVTGEGLELGNHLI